METATADITTISALEKIPTDAPTLLHNVSEWEKMGDSSKLAAVTLLMLTKLCNTEENMLAVERELKLLRETIQDVSRVSVAKITKRLQFNPELRDGFTKTVNELGEPKLFFKGSDKKDVIYKGYDALHHKLLSYFGYKDITYKILSEALLKSFNWDDIEANSCSDEEITTGILSKADYLYLSSRKRKITIPELKKAILPLVLDTPRIKNILLDAGWNTVKLGTCNTLFFTQGNTT